MLSMKQVQYNRISTESDDEAVEAAVIFRHTPNHEKRRTLPPHSSNSVQVHDYENTSSPWTSECISRLLVLFILFLLAAGFGISRFPEHKFHHHGQDHDHDTHPHEHPIYHHAAIAAGQKECSDVGVSIFKDGGNAVDAAIATLLCQGVVEPEYCGLGGGFIMNIFNQSTGRSTVIDARETAPSESTENMFNSLQDKDVIKGPLSIAVPGSLKGISVAYEKYGGGVIWERLFRVAIEKAEKGFLVNGELANRLRQQKASIVGSKSLCKIYCDGSGTDVKKIGDTVINLKLAETLRNVSQQGVDVFYSGPMATAMASEIQRDGGVLTARDFENYTAVERNAMKIALPNAGLILQVPPLPSGGPVLGIIMEVLDSYNISTDLYKNTTNLQWHRTVEAFKHAYGAQTRFADPAFLRDGNRIAEKLTSAKNIQRIRSKIVDTKTFSDPMYYGAGFLDARDQQSSNSHVSILAPGGDAVAVTSSINRIFGSLYISASTGILFNNQMSNFFIGKSDGVITDKKPHANFIEPGKRPLSSMAPCILLDAKTNSSVYIFGGSGGMHIPTSVALALLRLLYFGVNDFDDAIEEKRIHHQLMPDELFFEQSFDETILNSLKKIGHNVVRGTSPEMSRVNGIKNHGSHIHAQADTRNIGAGTSGW